MQSRQMAVLAVVAGVLAIALALLADTIGIGSEEDTLGWKQMALLVVGAALVVGGIVAALRGPREPGGPGEPGGPVDRPPTGTP